MKTEAEIGMVWLRISEVKAPGTASPRASGEKETLLTS